MASGHCHSTNYQSGAQIACHLLFDNSQGNVESLETLVSGQR